jgi:hypothetical protein
MDPAGPTPAERQTERRLSDLDSLVDRSDEPLIAAEGLQAGVSLVLSELAGPLAAPIRRVADLLLGRHEENVQRAVRILIEALGSDYDNTVQRLQTDPQLENFVLRVMATAASAAHQSKLGYYANLLQGTASTRPPSETERERLLDTLNALGLRHLRLFHAIAETEGVPLKVADQGSVWASIQHVSGIEQVEAEADMPDLVRLQLIASGWESTTNLRLSLTEYGLQFEDFVGGRAGRPRPRWDVQLVTGQSRLLEELAGQLGGQREMRLRREREGYFLTTEAWEGIDDVATIRNEAEEFVVRSLLARSLQSPQNPQPVIAVELIREWNGVEATTYQPAEFLEVSGPPADIEFPTALYLATAERLMASNPKVHEAVRLAAAAEWPRFVECLAIVESDLGYPVSGLPMVANELVERFNAEANSRGLERPQAAGPAQVSINEAAGLIRQVLQSWIMVKAGRWPEPMRPTAGNKRRASKADPLGIANVEF